MHYLIELLTLYEKTLQHLAVSQIMKDKTLIYQKRSLANQLQSVVIDYIVSSHCSDVDVMTALAYLGAKEEDSYLHEMWVNQYQFGYDEDEQIELFREVDEEVERLKRPAEKIELTIKELKTTREYFFDEYRHALKELETNDCLYIREKLYKAKGCVELLDDILKK